MLSVHNLVKIAAVCVACLRRLRYALSPVLLLLPNLVVVVLRLSRPSRIHAMVTCGAIFLRKCDRVHLMTRILLRQELLLHRLVTLRLASELLLLLRLRLRLLRVVVEALLADIVCLLILLLLPLGQILALLLLLRDRLLLILGARERLLSRRHRARIVHVAGFLRFSGRIVCRREGGKIACSVDVASIKSLRA